ncbi:MAG: prolyl oligopeptidase family serine peptidase [Gemmatimonadetes bacterium]|nr:prolyl oligopeptidase family serine peptidase [Gemmatimonadota bacterium]
MPFRWPSLRSVGARVLARSIALLPLVSTLASAQAAYRQPPAVIQRILDAPATPTALMSPDRTAILLLERPGLPPISEIAAPEFRVAGIRLDPRTSGPSRQNPARGISIMPIAGGAPTPLAMALPTDAGVGTPTWSPNGKLFAFVVNTSDALTLWVGDLAAKSARQLSTRRLNAVLGAPCDWSGDEALICTLVPSDRGAEPVAPQTPTGPIVQEALTGSADRAATYQDLLKSPYDEAIFAHYATSQLARIALDGTVTNIGTSAIISGATLSPDGQWMLVTTLAKPFSYSVPLNFFPTKIEVWTPDGRVARTLASRPLLERVSWGSDGAQAGPRNPQWRADQPATLSWIEALDNGDPTKQVPKRDRILALAAPFTGEPATLVETEWRARGIVWGRNDLAIATEANGRQRKTRTWVIDPSGKAAPRLLWERSSEDRYGDRGTFVTRRDARGQSVLHLLNDGKTTFLRGNGASPEGDRPFLDRFDLTTGQSTRAFQSTAPYYETIVDLLDDRGERLLTRRESVNEPPNLWQRDLVRRIAPQQLTQFKDPAPEFAGVRSERVSYKRRDGVTLHATVYLPPGYDKARDGALPFLLWAYPLEFGSADAASQVTGSPYRFTRPNGPSHLFALLQGYGVMDDPTMPIIGADGKEPNDTYVEQLVASAEAAIDQIVGMGVADRDRIGVGGHSYGAFMTANLLAHTRLFRAGIARSGAYNRTLTPFGFQGEERSFWQAQDLYEKMSPFNYADSIKTPILLVHGMADNNTGTFPIQSERMYAALKGNGATVRYVQLPGEAHGYAARESVGHTLAEMMSWLDQFVKPPKPRM